MHKRVRGFTLIELMITVAIVGILASIAMPSYSGYIERGHRGLAQLDLQRLQQDLATQFALRFNYTGITLAATQLPMDEAGKLYNVTAAVTTVTNTDDTVTLTAVPIAGKVMASSGNLTLSSSGSGCWFEVSGQCSVW